MIDYIKFFMSDVRRKIFICNQFQTDKVPYTTTFRYLEPYDLMNPIGGLPPSAESATTALGLLGKFVE